MRKWMSVLLLIGLCFVTSCSDAGSSSSADMGSFLTESEESSAESTSSLQVTASQETSTTSSTTTTATRSSSKATSSTVSTVTTSTTTTTTGTSASTTAEKWKSANEMNWACFSAQESGLNVCMLWPNTGKYGEYWKYRLVLDTVEFPDPEELAHTKEWMGSSFYKYQGREYWPKGSDHWLVSSVEEEGNTVRVMYGDLAMLVCRRLSEDTMQVISAENGTYVSVGDIFASSLEYFA